MTENKNHRRITEGFIDELTTEAGGAPVTYKWIGEECSAGEKTVKMTPLIYFVTLALLGQARSDVVELNCSDNATCIDHMAKQLVRSLRQQKSVKLFDLLTVEPLSNRQARSIKDPLTKLLTTHGISFDWNDFTFRFSNPEGKSDALDLEVFESRSVKGKFYYKIVNFKSEINIRLIYVYLKSFNVKYLYVISYIFCY